MPAHVVYYRDFSTPTYVAEFIRAGRNPVSMSPIREDVKKKVSPILSERETDGSCIQPDLHSKTVFAARTPDKA